MVIRKEEWKTIEEAPDYSVSNYGRVMRATGKEGHGSWRTFAGKILRVGDDGHGYLQVDLTSPDGKRLNRKVHRLVATAFHGPSPYKGAQVRHLNDVGTDNVAWNLKWTSSLEDGPVEQLFDAIRNGGAQNILSPEDAVEIVNSEESNSVLAEKFGVTRDCIQEVRKGRTWWHTTGLAKWIPTPREQLRMTDEEVMHIVNSPLPGTRLAVEIGISPQHISRIRKGVIYSEVTGIQYKRRNSYAKITPEIRAGIEAATEQQSEIAARYGVSQSSVSNIKCALAAPSISK